MGAATPTVFKSRGARRRFAVHILIGTILVIAAITLLHREFPFLFQQEAVTSFVTDFGPLAPITLIVLQIIQVVLAPIPGQVLAAVAGYLFGPWWGTLYNMIGIGIGSAVAFWLSRRYGRTYVERFIDDEAMGAFDGFVERHGLLSLFILFLVPGLPDDALCFLGGLTPIPLWKLVVVAIVGRAPAFFLVNLAGHLVAVDAGVLAAGLLVVIGGLSLIGYLKREWIASTIESRLS
jgi:uncharacterized membrane protein YdjX (TVP38/TMEM64 family)